WAFCLLLMSSWVFWRPNGGAPRQEGAATESLASPSQSSDSTSRHTCWAKIVQSLKVRQQRKSESNGIGGSNSGAGAGELPNNWAGQERSGADISKSLIRNRDPLKDSNHLRNLKGSAGSLLRLQALAQPPQRALSSSLDRDKESAISLCDFDLRPPTPIDLSRSIDEA
ncbi:proline-rich transmembrane protein 3-like, partial [Sinocyclocheilus rhinocerous]|uniref:proline-rich transmembrane protein 3-like n=1 Tax=Sinocyclocheilus rhinocerous TaxID=307959 RepID=UPI0007B99D22